MSFLIATFVSAWVGSQDMQGPLFLHEPPHRVEFSNSSGGRIDCTAHGSPFPEVEWILEDGSPVHQVSRQSTPSCFKYFPPK